MYTCKLRLLQFGLVDEVAVVESMGTIKGATSKPGKGDDSEDEEDDESMMEKRLAYVDRSINEAKKDGRLVGLMTGAKNPIAAEQRRDLVKNFLKDINSYRKCSNCSGYVKNHPRSLFCALTNITVKYLSFVPKGPLQQNLQEGASRKVEIGHAARRIPGPKSPGSPRLRKEVC